MHFATLHIEPLFLSLERAFLVSATLYTPKKKILSSKGSRARKKNSIFVERFSHEEEEEANGERMPITVFSLFLSYINIRDTVVSLATRTGRS